MKVLGVSNIHPLDIGLGLDSKSRRDRANVGVEQVDKSVALCCN